MAVSSRMLGSRVSLGLSQSPSPLRCSGPQQSSPACQAGIHGKNCPVQQKNRPSCSNRLEIHHRKFIALNDRQTGWSRERQDWSVLAWQNIVLQGNGMPLSIQDRLEQGHHDSLMEVLTWGICSEKRQESAQVKRQVSSMEETPCSGLYLEPNPGIPDVGKCPGLISEGWGYKNFLRSKFSVGGSPIRQEMTFPAKASCPGILGHKSS